MPDPLRHVATSNRPTLAQVPHPPLGHSGPADTHEAECIGHPVGHSWRMDQYRRGELVFDVIDEGPADGPVVVLLHGFPQFNTTWKAVIPRLIDGGYRCLAGEWRVILRRTAIR